MKKFAHLPHSAAMNREFTAAWRGEGRDIYSRSTKTPVGAKQLVPKVLDQHRLKAPTGAYDQGQQRHRVMA